MTTHSDAELIESIREAIKDNLPSHCDREFDLETDLVDICFADHKSDKKGNNWLNLVHLIHDLEIQFEITVTDDDLLTFKKVRDILVCIKSLLGARARTLEKSRRRS